MDRRLLKAGRAALGWSQSELADQAGVQRLVVARYENGTQTPHPTTMIKLVKALSDCGVDEIKLADGSVGIILRAEAFAAEAEGILRDK
ncbi:helix-turn-helix transcriptional regulator [Methylobacterium sp. E-045]|uniref:helix-turn-helix transcriptional regulator n=1 Tax=Methylobacterium sp. E-045 TaxID=2836575 RepID=UPI00391BF2FA